MPLKTNNNTSLTVEMTKRKFADKNIASVTSLTFQNKKNKERMAGSKQTDIALFMRVTTNNDQIVIEIEMEDDVSIGSILSFLFLNGTEKQSLLFNEKGYIANKLGSPILCGVSSFQSLISELESEEICIEGNSVIAQFMRSSTRAGRGKDENHVFEVHALMSDSDTQEGEIKEITFKHIKTSDAIEEAPTEKLNKTIERSEEPIFPEATTDINELMEDGYLPECLDKNNPEHDSLIKIRERFSPFHNFMFIDPNKNELDGKDGSNNLDKYEPLLDVPTFEEMGLSSRGSSGLFDTLNELILPNADKETSFFFMGNNKAFDSKYMLGYHKRQEGVSVPTAQEMLVYSWIEERDRKAKEIDSESWRASAILFSEEHSVHLKTIGQARIGEYEANRGFFKKIFEETLKEKPILILKEGLNRTKIEGTYDKGDLIHSKRDEELFNISDKPFNKIMFTKMGTPAKCLIQKARESEHHQDSIVTVRQFFIKRLCQNCINLKLKKTRKANNAIKACMEKGHTGIRFLAFAYVGHMDMNSGNHSSNFDTIKERVIRELNNGIISRNSANHILQTIINVMLDEQSALKTIQ